jgi:hypothetical protein
MYFFKSVLDAVASQFGIRSSARPPSLVRETGAFRIDLVVEGEGKRLAIECDGDRYQPLEKLSEDMDRQSILEGMGWIFTRIRSSEFLRNPSRTMKPIFEKLEALEIPSAGKTREIQEGPSSHEVIDHVIRRAEELRKTWTKLMSVIIVVISALYPRTFLSIVDSPACPAVYGGRAQV